MISVLPSLCVTLGKRNKHLYKHKHFCKAADREFTQRTVVSENVGKKKLSVSTSTVPAFISVCFRLSSLASSEFRLDLTDA